MWQKQNSDLRWGRWWQLKRSKNMKMRNATLFVDTFCEHTLWINFVDSFCGHCFRSHFVDLFCGPFLWTHFLWTLFVDPFCGHFLQTIFVDSLPANEPHDFDSLSNCWKSMGQCGKTAPSWESLGRLHCVGKCEGSLGIFLEQTLGCKTLGLPSENSSGALTRPLSTMKAPSTLSLGDSFSKLPRRFSTVAFTIFHMCILAGTLQPQPNWQQPP